MGLFLWPVIVTSVLAIPKFSSLRRIGYFALSIAYGYISMLIGNFLAAGCAIILMNEHLLGTSGASFEKYLGPSILVAGFIFMALPPIVISFFYFKKKP